MKRKIAAMLAALSVGALTLGACSAQPGVAVSVNGHQFTEADVARGVADYAELTGNTLEATSIAHMLPDAMKFTELAQQLGLEASDNDVNDYLNTLIDSGMVAQPADGIGTVMTEILRYTIIGNQINAMDENSVAFAKEVFDSIAESQQVQINPRYGTVSEDGSVIAPIFGDVVRLSEETP